MIHPISHTNKLGKTNLKTGKISESLTIEDTKINYKDEYFSGFNCYICVFNDEKVRKQYILYENKTSNKAILSELYCFPQMFLGKSLELPLNKNQICFAFIYESMLYLGSDPNCSQIYQIFDITKRVIVNICPILFHFDKRIYNISFIPSISSLLISGLNKIAKFTVSDPKRKNDKCITI